MKRILALITTLVVLLNIVVFPQVSHASEELDVYFYEDFKTGYDEAETKVKSFTASGLKRVLHNGEYVMQVSTDGGYTQVNFTKTINIEEKPRIVLEYQAQANMVGSSNNIGFLGKYGMPTCYIYGSKVKLNSYQDKENIGSASLANGVTVTVVYNNEKAERDIYIDGRYIGTYDSSDNTFYETYLESGELTLHFYNYIQSSSSLFYKYIKVYEAPADYSPETFMPSMYKTLGRENVFVTSERTDDDVYYGLADALGLWNSEDMGEYAPEEKITRLQFAGLLANAIKAETVNPTGIYKDIARRHFMAGTIETLNQLGIMKGVATDMFAPEESILLYDAATALTRALGYETFAQYKGGYVTGYADIAKKVGILKGISSANTELTQKEAMRMIYNFLNAEVFQMKTIDANGMMTMEATEGETVLSVYHDIIGIKGIQSSNDVTSLMSADGGDETAVTIGNKKLRVIDRSVFGYIGYEVEAYYDEETNVLLYCFVTDKNETFTIEADDFNAYSNGKIEYYDKNGGKKSASLSISTDAIYNGKATTVGKNLFDNFDAGQVKLIDNDGNGDYDVVIVQSYVNRVVDSKISDGDIITFKNNKSPMFLEKDYKNYKFMDAKGKEITFNDVAPGSVVSVMESKDKSYVSFYVSTNSIVGELEALTKSSESITVAGKKYNVSKGFFIDYPGLSTGIIGEFFMDVFGSVSAYSEYDTFGKGLAYLISIDSSAGLKKDLKLKVYTDENKLAIFETRDKIKLDGSSVTASSLLTNAIITNQESGQTISQLIAYELNDDGKLVSIDTSVFDAALEDENNTIYMIDQGDLKYNSVDKRFGTNYLNSGFSVFEIPENANSADADDFAYGSASYTDEASANTLLYRLSNNTLGVDIVVTIETEGSSSYNSYARACLVSGIEEVWDEEEEGAVTLLKYWESGAEGSVKVIDDSLIKDIVLKAAANEGEQDITADVTPGDVIIISKNSKEELKGVKLLVDYENPTAKAAGNRGSIHRAVFGVAYEAKGDLLNITADDITTMNEDEFTLEMHRIPTVYVYDSEREIVTLGTKSDLIDYKTAGANASKIVFYETKGYDYDLIIYR